MQTGTTEDGIRPVRKTTAAPLGTVERRAPAPSEHEDSQPTPASCSVAPVGARRSCRRRSQRCVRRGRAGARLPDGSSPVRAGEWTSCCGSRGDRRTKGDVCNEATELKLAIVARPQLSDSAFPKSDDSLHTSRKRRLKLGAHARSAQTQYHRTLTLVRPRLGAKRPGIWHQVGRLVTYVPVLPPTAVIARLGSRQSADDSRSADGADGRRSLQGYRWSLPRRPIALRKSEVEGRMRSGLKFGLDQKETRSADCADDADFSGAPYFITDLSR